MTAATPRAPDRWSERDCPVLMDCQCPTRAAVGHETRVHRGPAAARAVQRGTPQMATLPYDIDALGLEDVGYVLDPDGAERLGAAARPSATPCARDAVARSYLGLPLAQFWHIQQ
jgi:hypothetical protein